MLLVVANISEAPVGYLIGQYPPRKRLDVDDDDYWRGPGNPSGRELTGVKPVIARNDIDHQRRITVLGQIQRVPWFRLGNIHFPQVRDANSKTSGSIWKGDPRCSTA